jgi:hypothetical protein
MIQVLLCSTVGVFDSLPTPVKHSPNLELSSVRKKWQPSITLPSKGESQKAEKVHSRHNYFQMDLQYNTKPGPYVSNFKRGFERSERGSLRKERHRLME